MKPLVTIITPNFNNELYISETAKSILNQTYLNWEWIVVDDGSTDNSPNILKKYAQKDKRIKYIERYRNPKGPSTCRNIGIEKSNGEFIVFLDGDDLLAKFCIEERVNYMIKSTELDFCVFKMGTFGGKIEKQEKNNKGHWGYISMFIENKYPWVITSPIWRTEFLIKINGFDETLLRTTDPDIHFRALISPEVKYKILEDVKIDSFYRQRQSHKNAQWLYNVILSRIKYQKKIFTYFERINKKTKESKIIISSLKIGIIDLLKKWILVRIVDFETVYYDYLKWTKKKSLISRKNYFLLKFLAKLWKYKNITWIKNLHIKGFLFKLVK